MIWPVLIAAVAGAGISAIRWLRVAQREHYLPPSVTRFAWRWWNANTVNQIVGTVAVFGVIGSFFVDAGLVLLGLLAVAGPFGLPWRGRTSPLAWTDRLRRLAGITAGLVVLFVIWSILIRHPGPAMSAVVAMPRLIDAALALSWPVERRLSEKWIASAKKRLAQSGARVVAITGSYGKTTTKGYLAHLLQGSKSTVVTPASFNNRLGIAKAINDQLVAGIEVFVAEMGTYGPGEIAELCAFAPPEVSVITAIGPVHLERFGSIDRIVDAKAEILTGARVAVLNTDDQNLDALAATFNGEVIKCSATDRNAEVAVVEGTVSIRGESAGTVSADKFASNLACAVGAAVALGLTPAQIAARLDDLPEIAHRRQLVTSDSGVRIIDDTYNSNPAGARAALASLMALNGGGRRVVVTPGMVELGAEQRSANEAFADEVSQQATDLVIVGRTNRAALLEGAGKKRALVTVVESRPEAVEWVRTHLEAGDAVLYENDLPDHYP
jgi:UDP-N-acetylmuramoyl-tripeptide--D-alanyl-D-alanine ligase